MSIPFRPNSPLRLALLLLAALAASPSLLFAQRGGEGAIVGRWDLTVKGPDGEYPSWIEITRSGHRTLVGGYVGRFGSVRPVGKVELENGGFRFSVPPQWEQVKEDIVVAGRLEGGSLIGEVAEGGKKLPFEGKRAPALDEERDVEWGEPIDLLAGDKLDGWQSRDPSGKHGWKKESGVLVNAAPGQDLVTEQTFRDFRLAAEFRYPQGSNSGIYLRGRYEVQIEDNFGQPPESHKIGGVYGFLTPSFNAARPAGEWQTMEITLVGRRVSVILNERRILDQQLIPGITGGALDSREGEPGPIFIQGDHGPVEFRKLIVTPAK